MITDALDNLPVGSLVIDVSGYQAYAITGHDKPQEGDQDKLSLALKTAAQANPLLGLVSIKATEGMYKDAWFPLWVAACLAANLKWFPYHRFVSQGGSNDPVLDGVAQANNFLGYAYSLSVPDAGGCLDWERYGAETIMNPWSAIVFLNIVTAHTGDRAFMYSSANYLGNGNTTLVGSLGGASQAWLKDWRLWDATYPDENHTPNDPPAGYGPAVPAAYKGSTSQICLWQYTGQGTIEGFPGHVDRSLKVRLS